MEDALILNQLQPISSVQAIIFHSLYIDDVMIFLGATVPNAVTMTTIFDQLASIVGLQISQVKSKVHISRKVSNEDQPLSILGDGR